MRSRYTFPIKNLVEIINFWDLELAAKIASYWDL